VSGETIFPSQVHGFRCQRGGRTAHADEVLQFGSDEELATARRLAADALLVYGSVAHLRRFMTGCCDSGPYRLCRTGLAPLYWEGGGYAVVDRVGTLRRASWSSYLLELRACSVLKKPVVRVTTGSLMMSGACGYSSWRLGEISGRSVQAGRGGDGYSVRDRSRLYRGRGR
jgi:hypothetical protein